MHVRQAVHIDEGIHFGLVPLPQLGHYQFFDVEGSPTFLIDGRVKGVVAELDPPEAFGVG